MFPFSALRMIARRAESVSCLFWCPLEFSDVLSFHKGRGYSKS